MFSRLLSQIYLALGAFPLSHIFVSSLFWKLGCDQYLQNPSVASSISEAKVMGQKTKIGKKFYNHKC